MAKIRLEVVPAAGVDVEREFKELWGGSDANWDWLKRRIYQIDPREIKACCTSLVACDVIELPPCYLFGHLKLRDEAAWLKGLAKAMFMVDAVVHEAYKMQYYEARLAAVPSEDQTE